MEDGSLQTTAKRGVDHRPVLATAHSTSKCKSRCTFYCVETHEMTHVHARDVLTTLIIMLI
eukprot:756299-Hanusia_phi.AAC.3